MKIAVNRDWGGFKVPATLECEHHTEEEGRKYDLHDLHVNRTCPILIEFVERNPELDIKVVEIPDNSHWIISNYDGVETIYHSDSPIRVS